MVTAWGTTSSALTQVILYYFNPRSRVGNDNGGWDFARLLIEMERGGMMQNGKCSTPKISECHRTEKGVSLSDILEAEAPQKYFLSKEQTEKIVFK